MTKQQLRQALTEVAFTKFPVFVDPDKEKLEKQQREEAAEASRLKNLAGRVDHETLRKHEIVVGGRGGSLLDRFKESAAMTGKLGAREAAPEQNIIAAFKFVGRENKALRTPSESLLR